LTACRDKSIPQCVRNGTRLDKAGARGYFAALVFGAWICWSSPALAKDLVVKGAQLPGGSQQVGEDRYRSPANWHDTLQWFLEGPRATYKGYPHSTIVNQPGIRGIHIVNNSGKGEWEGLNIYELDGETRIYIVSKDPPKAGGGDAKAK
jgi:hypothetical protein